MFQCHVGTLKNKTNFSAPQYFWVPWEILPAFFGYRGAGLFTDYRKKGTMALMRDCVRRANFTTKPRLKAFALFMRGYSDEIM